MKRVSSGGGGNAVFGQDEAVAKRQELEPAAWQQPGGAWPLLGLIRPQLSSSRLSAHTDASRLDDHADAGAIATFKLTGPVASKLSGLQPQLDTASPAAATQPCAPLHELQLLLPAVQAEYRTEMQLMLRACQVASAATRHSPAAGTTLLLEPAQRDQLQQQVLSNCNEKHAAVTAAFRQAAQAVEQAQQPAAASAGSGDAETQQGPPAAAGAAGGEAPSATSLVWGSLQQLRASYQQEVIAATSALFAICRGFGGQCYALSPAASASIKAALTAAQRQHARVEQLWEDLILAAGGAV